MSRAGLLPRLVSTNNNIFFKDNKKIKFFPVLNLDPDLEPSHTTDSLFVGILKTTPLKTTEIKAWQIGNFARHTLHEGTKKGTLIVTFYFILTQLKSLQNYFFQTARMEIVLCPGHL